ncbi:head GIN domain-containing protein [soil metagenome]
MRIRSLAFAAAAAAAALAFAPAQAATTEKRALPEFHGIEIRGTVKLELHQRSTQSVEVTADDSVLAKVDTQVVDRNGVPTLVIGLQPGTRGRTPVTVAVDFTSLSALSISGRGDVNGGSLKSGSFALSVSGMGDVKLDDLDVGNVEVHISGVGDVQLGGHAATLGVNVSGKGDFDGHSFDVDNVSIHLSGLGDSKVKARKTLDVSISGLGNVSYQGDAVVTSNVSGRGKVEKQ